MVYLCIGKRVLKLSILMTSFSGNQLRLVLFFDLVRRCDLEPHNPFPDIQLPSNHSMMTIEFLNCLCQIGYVEDNYVHTPVIAEVMNPESGKSDVTNIFHFTFRMDSPPPTLMPHTYQGKGQVNADLYCSLNGFILQSPWCTWTRGDISRKWCTTP